MSLGAPYGSFRKLGVPYFGVLIIRILLFRVLYLGVLGFQSLDASSCTSAQVSQVGALWGVVRYAKDAVQCQKGHMQALAAYNPSLDGCCCCQKCFSP